ncbi:MAG: hypothetical protein WDN06_11590 [Asticcacaulis sp.]
MMNWRELLGFSLGAIKSHPMRSALTALGVVIGVAAVVIMTSIGVGAPAEGHGLDPEPRHQSPDRHPQQPRPGRLAQRRRLGPRPDRRGRRRHHQRGRWASRPFRAWPAAARLPLPAA